MTPVMALKESPIYEVSSFGAACGTWLDAHHEAPGATLTSGTQTTAAAAGVAPSASSSSLSSSGSLPSSLGDAAAHLGESPLPASRTDAAVGFDAAAPASGTAANGHGAGGASPRAPGVPPLPTGRLPTRDVSIMAGASAREPESDDPLRPRLLNVTTLAEKPSIEYARRHLCGMPQLPDDHVLTAFGMYVVPPSVFLILEHQVANNLRGNEGSFGLMPALETLRRNEGLHGYVIDGERFDLGKPSTYYSTLTAFLA